MAYYRRGMYRRYRKRRLYNPVSAIVKRSLAYNHELKYIDYLINQSSSAPWAVQQYMSPVVQGTSGSNRTGRLIRVSHIELYLTANVTPTAAGGSSDGDVFRCMIVVDNECRGATFTATDLVLNTTLCAVPRNQDNVNRFKIIYDSGVQAVNPTTAQVGGSSWRTWNKRIHCPFVMHFFNGGNAGTAADCEKNGLFWTFGSQQSFTAVQGYARIFFRDV